MDIDNHRTGTIKSGDVEIYYRHFGSPGGVPMLLFHGGNYYDSYDWIEIAETLSQDREVVAFDSRGFGESGWSPSKNYSHGAHMADAIALLDQFGWERTILVGHSRGGAYALLFASRFTDRSAGLVVIDYCPGFGIGPRGMPIVETQSIGNRPKVFADADQAFASTSRYADVPGAPGGTARFQSFLRPVDGGVIIAKRDPDFANPIPTVPDDKADLNVGDMWLELERVRVPILLFRGLKSKSGFTDEDMGRLRREHPEIEVVDVPSGHDIVAEAPDTLTSNIKAWLEKMPIPAR